MAEPFTLIPNAALPFIAGLTKRQSAVLLALWSFKGEDAVVYPSKAKLEERSGINSKHISKVTRELAELGALEKDGKGGRSRTARYTLLEPWKMPDSSETSPRSGLVQTPPNQPQNQPQTGTKTSPTPGLRIEQTIEHTNPPAAKAAGGARDARATPPATQHDMSILPMKPQKSNTSFASPSLAENAEPEFNLEATPAKKTAKPKKLSYAKRAQQNGGWVEAKKPDDISQEMWDTWCRQRTKHKWYLTDFAVDSIRADAESVNITLQEAVRMMIINDWRGFNVRWDSVKAALNLQPDAQYKPAAQPARHSLTFDERKEIGATLEIMEWRGDISGDDSIIMHRLMEEGMLRMSVFKMFAAKHIDFQQLLKECGAAPQTLRIAA